MAFRYILKHLLLPPGIFLLLILLGWWLRRRAPRLASACFVGGFAGIWLMSLPVVVEWSARGIERHPAIQPDEWASLGERADAIVVLGGGRQRGDPAWGADQSSWFAQERVRYAARLSRASALPIATSGGLHYGTPPSEAQIMAEQLAVDYGLQARWQEGQSRTTWENAQRSAELLQPQGVKRIVLVTQAWHMQRAVWCFEQAGFDVVPAPFGFFSVANGEPLGGWLPDGRALWRNTLLFNEAVGLLAYPLVYASEPDE